MAGELTPVPVEPKSASREFWARYHAYRRVRQMETRPDDPIRPDRLEEARMKRDSPFDFEYRYEIARDGVALSWFTAETMRPGAPGYDSNRHLFAADWSVHPEHRRRGLGASWVPLVLELMDRHGCTVLTLASEEESGHAFMKWLRAEAKFQGAENRLDLAGVDWGMVRRWIDEGARRSPQTRLEIYDGHLPEAMWSDFTLQLSGLLNTVPFENLDHGEIVITPDHMRDWYARLDLGDECQHTVIAREPDGVIAGMTDVLWRPHRPAIIDQQFTGVRPDARGRGIGKWIKAAMLAHLRELYPDARWVATDNAGSNAPMLAINKKLGFKQFRAGTEYQMSRDALAARVEQLGAKA